MPNTRALTSPAAKTPGSFGDARKWWATQPKAAAQRTAVLLTADQVPDSTPAKRLANAAAKRRKTGKKQAAPATKKATATAAPPTAAACKAIPISEAEMDFASHTRIFNKKRKDWRGRANPNNPKRLAQTQDDGWRLIEEMFSLQPGSTSGVKAPRGKRARPVRVTAGGIQVPGEEGDIAACATMFTCGECGQPYHDRKSHARACVPREDYCLMMTCVNELCWQYGKRVVVRDHICGSIELVNDLHNGRPMQWELFVKSRYVEMFTDWHGLAPALRDEDDGGFAAPLRESFGKLRGKRNFYGLWLPLPYLVPKRNERALLLKGQSLQSELLYKNLAVRAESQDSGNHFTYVVAGGSESNAATATAAAETEYEQAVCERWSATNEGDCGDGAEEGGEEWEYC